ncbi:LpqN/LpqT family lipoprotein [Mycobacterium sp. CVI_P3]|uniref:LpqN/LpqT family lipoprotein n=1 Tax=Mycobacterium pinniadriaticum TaxID=2994102 RepID=A0ABT3SDN3_9MYCO|nr:LpqN/LpqT family lipoprotein [Mycobacterium pinniadriaticum]MCX2931160.1 LpqN/LpqT family lipoprotein [Mycobacterium pinniadriaticum]MCX2937616.1 LpqN/LpqT family lipoprotein [Mycobacterium pinniadriaticum]
MNKVTAVATAGLAAVSLSVALVGCGSDSKTESTTSTSTSTSTATSTSISTETSTSSKPSAGKQQTIQDYLKENQITESPVKRGDPGSPNIDLAMPPGWKDAGAQTPDWAYGAIVYDSPEDPSDPPSIIAIVSKLTGNVDPKKILQFAPGELENLPDWEPLGDPSDSTLGGFDAVQLGGNYMKDGKKRIIAQKTVVIPGQDGLYVLQMNADALDGQEGPLMDATGIIDDKTTITP